MHVPEVINERVEALQRVAPDIDRVAPLGAPAVGVMGMPPPTSYHDAAAGAGEVRDTIDGGCHI
jgi:hypothetical protein